MKNVAIILLSIMLFTSQYSFAQEPEDRYEKVNGMWEVTRYYDDGAVRERGAYNEEGTPEGRWLVYNEQGEVISEATYANGKKEGRWLIWAPDGSYLYEVVYANNYLVKSQRWKIEESNLVAVD